MKRRLLIFVLSFYAITGAAQHIDKAEYYIDSDPGIGSGVNVPVTEGSVLTGVSFNIPVASLSEGFHFVHFRVRDGNGNWSHTEYRTIFKGAASANPPVDVIAAEYFIDTDPGIGHGTDILIESGNILEPLTFDIPADALTTGFHHLYLRVKDANGNWSATERRLFYKEVITTPPPLADLVLVEYFIDTDPGLGEATSIAFTPGASINGQMFLLDLSVLDEGPHKIYVRAKDADNNWSLVHVENISVCNFPATILNEAREITTSGFTASWAEVTGATAYQIDVSKDTFLTYVQGYKNKTVSSPSEAINFLSSGTPYQVRVRAVGNCASINSDTIAAITTLNVPYLNYPTDITPTSFEISWYEVTEATGYRLDVSMNNFETFVSGYENKFITGTSTSVSALESGAIYQYRLRAENDFSISANTQTSSVTTVPIPPIAKAGLANSMEFTAQWNPSPGAVHYELDVSSDHFASFISGYENRYVAGTSELVTGLIKGTSYQYRVRAVNTGGASEHSNIIEVTTTFKDNQSITFNTIETRTLGDFPFPLFATSSSGLTVEFSSTSPKISINGDQVSMLGAGSVEIVANQSGSDLFNAAPEVSQIFCINPPKPVITISEEHTASPKLTSSNEGTSEWYHNSTLMPQQSNPSINVLQEGVYNVRTIVDDCESLFSDDFVIIISSVSEHRNNISLYPVPATDRLYITGIDRNARIIITDMLGKTVHAESKHEAGLWQVTVSELISGNYIFSAVTGRNHFTIKFTKE